MRQFTLIIIAVIACMTLNAATKDWRKILGFYADKMDMVFHSAHMIKPLGKK